MPTRLLFDAHVDAEIFTRWPGYRAGIVVARNIRNGPSDDRSRARLDDAVRRFTEGHDGRPLAEHPHIAAWRGAFRDFGSKPSRYRCSAEALLRRALKDGLPQINQIVDLYNAVSVVHAIPLGGEDLDHVRGAMHLRVARGDEPFDTREAGQDTTELADAGEVIWADDAGVTCRRWNWRQCTRTELTEHTTNAYFIIDVLPPYGDDEVRAAIADLTDGLAELCPGAQVEADVLHAGHPRATWPDATPADG